jgi:hypothetical protein
MMLSADWVAAWVDTFGKELNPRFLTFAQDEEVVGCCIVVARKDSLWGLPLKRIYLNTAGEPRDSDLCIEGNNLLYRGDSDSPFIDALTRYLTNERWDELVINGVDTGTAAMRVAARFGRVRTLTKHARYVDLCAIRNSGGDYLSTLSANTREQVRRTKRWYERTHGPISVRISQKQHEVLTDLHDLMELHESRWSSKGMSGAFAARGFKDFHQTLSTRASESGRVHVVRVSSGEHTVGILYNFIINDHVAFYQCGISYGTDNRQKPGLLTHACAIQAYVDSGYSEYDFMGRETQYKRSLAPFWRDRHWLVVERDTAKMHFYSLLRSAKRSWQPKRDVNPAQASGEA